MRPEQGGILHVVGTRPNFMKIAPLMRAIEATGPAHQVLVHTGQHYDETMSGIFFRDLNIREPDVNLDVGSASHAVQTAEVMKAFEPTLQRLRPDLVVVVGDVNSTLACTLVATKLHVPVAHVEAGLRSGDRRMPEEINRIVTDQLSDLLFTPSRDANENLRSEGIPPDRVHFVGNIMIDSLLDRLGVARAIDAPASFGVAGREYALVTLHRPSNVDDRGQLQEILTALAEIARERTVLFPIHPRTRRSIQDFGLQEALGDVRLIEPVSYLEMLSLMEQAWMVLTDSGGIQEETTALGVPCLTLRSTTERPVTIELGTNTLVPDRSREAILDAVATGGSKAGRIPEKWDGRSAIRIAEILLGRPGTAGSSAL